MNYIAELNAFHNWLEQHSLTGTSQLMWFKLIGLHNRWNWVEWVQVDNLYMMSLIDVKNEKTLTRARNELISNGLIEYKKGKRNQKGRYKIISLQPTLPPNFTVNTGGNDGANTGGNDGANTGDTIYKHKHKLKHNKKINKKGELNVEASAKFDDTSEPYRLSLCLFEKIKKINPKHKEPNLQSWAKHIDLMIRRDGRDTRDIRAVIDFATSDSFWQNNILSTSKLRKQFDTLYMQMSKQKKNYTSNRKSFNFEQHNYDFEAIEKQNLKELEEQVNNIQRKG